MSQNNAPSLSGSLHSRLSLMMFLQYAIWGAWLPFLWSYLSGKLGFTTDQIGQIFAAGAVGAILGPALAGPIADRFVNTEKLLAISHLIGAALIWQLSSSSSFSAFVGISLVYGFIYMPTLSLTNSLSFAHLPDRDRDFGRVRLWGTFGWIAVGLAMGHWLKAMHSPVELLAKLDDPVGEAARIADLTAFQVAGKVDAFKLSAVLGLVMGLYCLTLPKTPPTGSSESNPALKAAAAIKFQPLLTLFLLAIPVSCIHQFYFVHAESFLGVKQIEAPGWMQSIFGVGGGGLMTIGQMSEVIVIGLIPLLAKSLSRKAILMIGLVAYAARMALFAYVDSLPLPVTATLILGIALHGVCFGCFIFVAYMVVDEETSPDIRASAQNLFNLVIVGIGVIVGSMVASSVAEWSEMGKDAAGNPLYDYTKLFSAPMYAALACFVVMALIYPNRSPKRGDSEVAA